MFTKACIRSMALIAGAKILHHDKDEYNQLGLHCIRQVSSNGDTVSSLQHQRLGKVYKLRVSKVIKNSKIFS